MKNKLTQNDIASLIWKYGADIICSDRMQSERSLVHHRKFNCYDHSVSVACDSVWLARKIGLHVNMRSLIRGALLHDYFLYNWRETKPSERMHGFAHAGIALKNAMEDFDTDYIQRDIIAKHMFPLNISPPRCRESVIVTIADKICASCEIVSFIRHKSTLAVIEMFFKTRQTILA